MKSFFQISEQARKHRQKKLREADGEQAAQDAEPAKAAANQQIQNDQRPNQEPKSVSYAEIPDIDLVTDFQKKLPVGQGQGQCCGVGEDERNPGDPDFRHAIHKRPGGIAKGSRHDAEAGPRRKIGQQAGRKRRQQHSGGWRDSTASGYTGCTGSGSSNLITACLA